MHVDIYSVTSTSAPSVSKTIKSFVNNHLIAFIGCTVAIIVVLIIVVIAYRKLMEIRNSTSKTKRKRYYVDDDNLEYTVDEKEERAKFGWLSCKMTYETAKNCLKIEKMQCTSLFSPGGYILNCFLRIRIEPRRWNIKMCKTNVFENSNDPFYTCTCKFYLPLKKLKKAVIVWEILDKNLDNGRSVDIGIVRATLNTMDPKTFYDMTKDLRLRVCDNVEMKEERGDVCVVLRNLPLKAKFTVTILEAKELKIKKTDTYPPVYATVTYYHRNKKIAHEMTATRYNTNCPYFMDSFTFSLKIGKTGQSYIIVKVLSKMIIGFDNIIGMVKIGSNTESISGKKHWNEMVLNPKKAIALWHPL